MPAMIPRQKTQTADLDRDAQANGASIRSRRPFATASADATRPTASTIPLNISRSGPG